jgi:hypothetical protein
MSTATCDSPQTASFGPCRRSPSVEILNVALLRLRFQLRCGLGLNQNLPIVNGHVATLRRENTSDLNEKEPQLLFSELYNIKDPRL